MIVLRKRLRRASLDGQYFFLNDTNIDTGRRTGRFEFPFQELPTVQDMGKQGQVISIAAFVAGANYRSDSERLLKIAESPGTKKFFHPYYGTRTVVVKNCRVNENNLEGGIVYFSFQFLETTATVAGVFGLQNMPLVGLVGGSDLLTSASQAVSDCIDSANQAVGYADELNDSILTATEFCEKVFSPVMHAEDSLSNLSLALNDMRATTARDYNLGTQGMITAWQTLVSVVCGATLDDSSGPYAWNHPFPPSFSPDLPFWPIILGTQAFAAGVQATHLFGKFPELKDNRKAVELRSLYDNLKRIEEGADGLPEVFLRTKTLKSHVISLLFQAPLVSVPNEEEVVTPNECLLLNAYESKQDLSQLEKLSEQYRYCNPLFPKECNL